ncbi:MAG: DNA polymerase III subunit beta [FCB group bacterium]|jgi:DNA polymerase-3 subunit beta|nr:DNA polymerase III subunit beta [FCB group bacterium]
MKARLNRHELADALGAIGGVVATRTPKPILQCVLIDARADHCLLAATDQEIGLRIVINQVEIMEQGQVVLPADKLSQIVRESLDEVIDLELNDTVCHLRGEGTHFQMFVQDPADFPPVGELEGSGDFEIDAKLIRRMADWTIFAAARENTRYAINGVLWDKIGQELSLVATDGRRLSYAHGQVADGDSPNIKSIVPVKAMGLLQRILVEADTNIAVKLTGNQIMIRTIRATLSTGLVEGQFPKYQDVIPSDCDRIAQLKTAEFASAVRQAALLTNEESKGIRLAFRNGILTLSSRAPSQGEATIDIPANYAGTDLLIGFNPYFLVDALKAVQASEVTLKLKDANRPGILTADPNFLYVVMPVNLS